MKRRVEPKKAAASANRRGIQSVEIGLRVIDALRKSTGPLTLKELAADSRLPASNCHRYLVSFVRVGYVTQDPLTGRYDLGPELLQAGLAALGRLDPIAVGNDCLAGVVDATGYTGQLAIWADDGGGRSGVVIVRWMPGAMAVRTSLALGSTLPLLSSATGRVFLAYLPARRTARQAEKERAALSFAPADVARLAADTRAAGYAQVSGDAIPGLSAACVPLLDSTGEAAVTLTLIGLSEGIDQSAISALTRASAQGSHALGWSGKH
jgi:DNA-binding IclR family transcriptional regulator